MRIHTADPVRTLIALACAAAALRLNADTQISTVQDVAALFSADAPLAAAQVPYTHLGDETLPSRFYENRTMRRINLRMTSQTYRGVICQHDTAVYLPDHKRPEGTLGTAAIILGRSKSWAKNKNLDWLESVVLGMGVPCIVINQILDAKQFGARSPGELMSFGQRTFLQTNNPRESGYYALAKIFSAAATVAGDLPGVRAERCIATGSSKGGMAALIACAGDRRIVGAYPTAWSSGSIVPFTRLKGQRWGWNVKPKKSGPAGESAARTLAMIRTPIGRRYRRLFDPAEWGDLLADKFIMPAVGTNDPLFHLLSDSNYFDDLNCRKAFLRVPNYAHGREHPQHALAWRSAVAAALLNRQIPTVQLSHRREADQVVFTAVVRGHNNGTRISFWQASGATGDYRRAKWKLTGKFTVDEQTNLLRLAKVSKPESGTTAYFLQLEDSATKPTLINSSNLIELGEPTTYVAPTKPLRGNDDGPYDVVIYGGTSAGIAAAVQVKRMGRSVAVIEPAHRIGGLTTGGLGSTDIGNKKAIGGIAREFYQRVHRHYQLPENWKWQTSQAYEKNEQNRTDKNRKTMWNFEPSAALAIMNGFVQEHDIPVYYGERLDRTFIGSGKQRIRGITMRGGQITALVTESGNTYRGRVFIDATYEGDLMAGSGVDATVGREDNAVYSETLSGVQTANAVYHQFKPGVDPYVTPEKKDSGLLPAINPTGPGEEGKGDVRVQAYCFRMCLTDHPENRIPFSKPSRYDPLQYELLLRNFEAGETNIPWINSTMPNRKSDINNKRGFSTDYIGQNYDYPEANYSRRREIIRRHRTYQQGLMWTLANHPRVPANIRKEISRWGTCHDEFEREDGWQQQLYIRESRRMIGDYVMTQHNCQGKVLAKRSVGLAAYTMDSHHVQRYVDKSGHVQNEGDVEIGGFPPYPIDYGAIVPRKAQCSNLLVPVCLSASHMAFGSIRMEPVFMALGQSAATAAVQSIEAKSSVQDIDYNELRSRLLKDRQVLAWTTP